MYSNNRYTEYNQKPSKSNLMEKRLMTTNICLNGRRNVLLNVQLCINFCGVLTVLCSEIRHCAKRQNVSENAVRHGCCRAAPFSTPLFSLMPQRVGPMGFIPPPKGTSANTRINPLSPKTFPYLSKFTNFDDTAVYPLRHWQKWYNDTQQSNDR
jgi:hypothetical protein